MPLAQELSTLTTLKVAPGSCVSIANNITVCLSGIGKQNTRKAFAELMNHKIDLIISWGSAAGLSSELNAGDLLIPELITVSNEVYTSDRIFCEHLLSMIPKGLSVHRGPITETNKVLRTKEDKQALFQTGKFIAADMESGTLARLAADNSLPFAVIRAVSDPVNVTLPKTLIDSFNRSSFNPTGFVVRSLLRPSEWSQLIKLNKSFKKAKKSLNFVGQILIAQSDQWMYPPL